MKSAQKILVANRGEIALRIMRSAKEMGLKTVAVYSTADRLSPHVFFADEAYCIGPPPAAQSYLLGEKIIEIAKNAQVDLIHPGYGFLSENKTFAQQTLDAGIIFIGPSAHAIDLMGNKISAKEAVKKFDIPLVPGTESAITDKNEAKAIAEKIGFPVLLKAAAGGGGKGMRIVNEAAEFEDQLLRASSEALAAFGDDAVFIEKYIVKPRHIEIQILADTQGNCVYLFERECSIQRRHQKLVEEAPSALLDEAVRKKMGMAAVNVAKAAQYHGAGTVEFLVDQNLNFYFLEMNTRLQVEHPITEMITGIDLVKAQIEIALGKPLPFQQEDLSINGHAIELRVCAEDPMNQFLPDTGILKDYQPPFGAGVRVDDGFRKGMEIPVFYDSMIAKLIVHAADRNAAIQKMKRAIHEYQIQGIKTTLPFGMWVMNHPAFEKADLHTGFIDTYFSPEALNIPFDEDESLIAAVLSAHFLNQKNSETAAASIAQENSKFSNWKKNRTL